MLAPALGYGGVTIARAVILATTAAGMSMILRPVTWRRGVRAALLLS